ncbi:MAG: hypothetical protein HYU53_10970 [Acidobacteria bacterium]|nr:hypothetical protein [Acidobacteriota bacterium]
MPRHSAGVQTIEVVRDDELKAKEREATATFRKVFPEAPPLKLYRTSDGRIGFQVAIGLSPGDRKLFNDAYAAVMKILGEKRGRPRGTRKVQAKLRLTEDVYKALKATADSSHKSLSSVVEDLAYRARIVG